MHSRAPGSSAPPFPLPQLKVVWPLEPCLEGYARKTHEMLGGLIGHEGKGSLLSALKGAALATALSAGVGADGEASNSLFCFFSVTVTLTDAGAAQAHRVLELVCAYISMLRTKVCPLPPRLPHEGSLGRRGSA